MSRIGTRSLLSAGLLVCALAVGGCIFSPQDDPEPTPPPVIVYVWPDTREKLMKNFEQAYGEMNIEEYEKILHPDYKFIFTNNDIWERQDDIASTTNMFAGRPGEDETGLRNGVQSIDVNTMVPLGDWAVQPSNHPYFPDSQRILYQVQIVFNLLGDDGSGTPSTITVSSNQFFYLKSEEIDQGDGTTRTRWFLVGQQDQEGEG